MIFLGIFSRAFALTVDNLSLTVLSFPGLLSISHQEESLCGRLRMDQTRFFRGSHDALCLCTCRSERSRSASASDQTLQCV